MTDYNERKWTSPYAQAVIAGKKYCQGESHYFEEWLEQGMPLLTPRARTVLEAVEGLEEHCRDCKARIPCHSGRDGTRYDIDIINACAAVLHDDIRRAIREKP